MNRIAFLIGNTRGLGGVKKDLAETYKFLRSPFGGSWYRREIHLLQNPHREDLMDLIGRSRGNYDFCFLMFSGHGGYQQGTVLEINRDEEIVRESELVQIAPKQISIFDCCRNVEDYDLEDRVVVESRSFSEGANTRRVYERRIDQAINQQNIFYACSIGESAHDSNDGGLYLHNLLRCARNVQDDFKLAADAHEEACLLTQRASMRLFHENQHPDARLQRIISRYMLPISVNASQYLI